MGSQSLPVQAAAYHKQESATKLLLIISQGRTQAIPGRLIGESQLASQASTASSHTGVHDVPL